MSHSVRALQWRLACTTSSVLYQRRFTNIRYHICKRRVFLPSFNLIKNIFTNQTGCMKGISDRRPVKDSDLLLPRQWEVPYRHTSERILGT